MLMNMITRKQQTKKNIFHAGENQMEGCLITPEVEKQFEKCLSSSSIELEGERGRGLISNAA